jgi:sugar phosphate isomerase/epimerase
VRTDSHGAPKFSISQVSTLTASFDDDLRSYVEGGVDAVGIWELKLGEGRDEAALEAFEASGLGAATAVPAVPSILPLALLPGPADPRERIDAILRSIHRLAPFRPAAILCITGPCSTGAGPDRALVVEGLRELGAEAERAGLLLALEPFQREGLESWSIVNTLSEAVELVDEAGSPAIGVQFDVWHLWNTPDLLDEIARHAHRLAGVHVSDWREPTRGWADRVLPGDGGADVATILGALDRAGWDGFYDLELFSDNGAFGTTYPDSLWDVESDELVRRGRESFIQCWDERRVAA